MEKGNVKFQKRLEREIFARTICSELNNSVDLKNSLNTILRHLQKLSGCEAVGIRLEDRGDYPYYTCDGFPEDFIQRESQLCAKDECGERIFCAESNSYLLECMCGNVIRGNFDPELPFFTRNGSFWINSTTALLASTSEKERQGRTRDYCHACGYESVALVPLKAHGRRMGLLQLNDRQRNCLDAGLIAYLEMVGEQIGVAVQNSLIHARLQEKDALSKALFDHNPVEMIVVDREGRIAMFNRVRAKLGGRAPEIGELMYVDYAGKHGRNMRAELMRCIETCSMQAFSDLKYGAHFLSVTIAGFSHGAIITAQDVTAQKEMEETLRRQSVNLSRSVKELNCHYEISDILQSAADIDEESLLQVVKAIQRNWQFPVAVRLAVEGREYQTEGFRETTWLLSGGIKARGAPSERLEVHYLEEPKPDAGGVSVDSDRQLFNAIVNRLCRFIERKRMERDLQESEQRFKSIAETIEEVFWITSVETGKILYVSPAYERVWGRSCESLHANPGLYLEAMHPDDLPKVLADYKAKGPNRPFSHEYRIFRPDGSLRWIWDRGFPHPDGHYVGVAQDITARKLAEDALAEAYSKVEFAHEELLATRRSERLAFTGRIAASIAHEIRNPSTNVSLALSQLSETFEPEGTQKKYVEIMENNIKRINSLITELLNCARPPELSMKLNDIHALLDEALESVETKIIAQKISVKKNFTSQPAMLKFDRKYMERALLNIILNAIEAMPKRGGGLKIATECNRKAFQIKIGDNGKGIPEENIIKIFDPFFSSKRGGTGLGLTTCYGVIASHGGTIEVESKLGKGSLFTVSLPI